MAYLSSYPFCCHLLENSHIVTQQMKPLRDITMMYTVLILLLSPCRIHAAAPTLVLQSVVRSTRPPVAPPLLTPYWAISANHEAIIGSKRRGGGTNLEAGYAPDYYLNITVHNVTVTSLVNSLKTSAFVAVGGDMIFFFTTNSTSITLVNTYSGAVDEEFDLFSAGVSPKRPLVLNDTLYIGSSSKSAHATLSALTISTGALQWSAAFTNKKFANFPQEYNQQLDALLIQTSLSGSDTTTYLYRTDGTAVGTEIENSDNPDYRGVVISPTVLLQARFSMSFFQLPAAPGGNVTLLQKSTFSNLGCIGIMLPIEVPILVVGSNVYTVCLFTVFAVNINTYNVASRFMEPGNQSFTLSAGYNLTSSNPLLFVGTQQGKIYKINFAQNALVLVYTDPDSAIYGTDPLAGAVSLVAYYPFVSSNQPTLNTQVPMVALASRVTDTVTTIKGIYMSSASVAWQTVRKNFALIHDVAVDSQHVAASSDYESSHGTTDNLLLYSVAQLVDQNQTIGRSLEPFFVQSPSNPTIVLGVAEDYDTNAVLSVSTNGLFQVTSTTLAAPTNVCPISPAISSLASPPLWVFKRINNYTNVSYNASISVNATVNVTVSNTTLQNVTLSNTTLQNVTTLVNGTNVTSLQNVTVNTTTLMNVTTNTTVLANRTVNQTVLKWRLDVTVFATKSLCFVDNTNVLRCYNTSTSSCSSSLQLCDTGGGSTPNVLSAFETGSGLVIVFCTAGGASATIGAQVIDVTTMRLSSFGDKSTAGILGAWDAVEGSLYIPLEMNGALATAAPEAKSYRVDKYLLNSSTAVWSQRVNVSFISNLALDLAPPGINTGSVVHGITSSLSSTNPVLRSYRLVTLATVDGFPLNNMSAVYPSINFGHTSEKSVFLGVARNATSSQSLCLVFSSTFYSVINATWPPQSSRLSTLVLRYSTYYASGLIMIKYVTPLLAVDFGMAIMATQYSTIAFNIYNGSAVWFVDVNTTGTLSKPVLTRITNSVMFFTSSGIAIVDIVSGIQYATMSYMTTSSAVYNNQTVTKYALISEVTNGVVSSYTSTRYAAAVCTSEGVFSTPFYISPTIGSTFGNLTAPLNRIKLRTMTMTPNPSRSLSLSLVITPTQWLSNSSSPSPQQSNTRTDDPTLTVNPLLSRTPKLTKSFVLSDSQSGSVSNNPTATPTHSKALRKPTHSGSADATETMTQEIGTVSKQITASRRLSESRSQAVSLSGLVTVSALVSPTKKTQVITASAYVTPSIELVVTATQDLTATPVYVWPPTPQPTPAPTPVPPNLAAPPEEASYGWVAGPSIGIVVIIAVVVGAILVKQHRNRVKRAEAMKRHQRGDDIEIADPSYEPPALNMDREADAIEMRE